MPYVAPPFPPLEIFVAPESLSWALATNPCAQENLDCRAKARQALDTIRELEDGRKKKYDQDKKAYELKWSGNRTKEGMPIAAGYEKYYNDKGEYTGPTGAAAANVSAAVNSVANETAKAERLKTNISNAVASGSCLTSLATDAVFNSNECAAVRAKVEENKKKGMSLKDAIQAVLNPPKSPLAQAGQKLGKAVDANKAAQAKLGRNGSKAKGGKKPDFKKQMARARGRGR